MDKITREAGFTLIEILISLTILSLVLGVIMGGFRLGNRTWEKGEQRLEELQRLRSVFQFLVQDIKSCIRMQRQPDSDAESGEQKRGGNRQNQPVVFIGERNSLLLVTTSSGIDPELKKGILRLVYYAVSEEEGKSGLVMAESPFLYQDPFDLEKWLHKHSYSLYPEVTSLEFEYYGVKEIQGKVKEENKEPEWHEDWNKLEQVESGNDYCKNLPEKVRVTIHQRHGQEGDEEEQSMILEIPLITGERKRDEKV